MLPKHDFKPNFLWSKVKLPPIVIALKWFCSNTLKFDTGTFIYLQCRCNKIPKFETRTTHYKYVFLPDWWRVREAEMAWRRCQICVRPCVDRLLGTSTSNRIPQGSVGRQTGRGCPINLPGKSLFRFRGWDKLHTASLGSLSSLFTEEIK